MRSAQEIHNAWCDYMINKATAPRRITSVKATQKLPSGIKSNRMSRNEIILALAKIGKRGQNIMPVYIINNPKNGGIYTRQEMETTYKTNVNKRKFRTFTAWVNALEKSGQLEIA